MNKYTWNEHSFLSGNVDAEVAGIELERIRTKHDGLRAAEIVEESRPESAPLHPAFEWDDFQAAEKHRQWQARQLVRSIRVVTSESDTRPVYVNVVTEGDRRYESVNVVVQDVDLFAQAVGYLRGKAQQMEHSVQELVALAPPVKRKAAQRLLEDVTAVRQRVEAELV